MQVKCDQNFLHRVSRGMLKIEYIGKQSNRNEENQAFIGHKSGCAKARMVSKYEHAEWALII